MKLYNLFEANCPGCGGWDIKQGGRGHKARCPTKASAGSPIAGPNKSLRIWYNLIQGTDPKIPDITGLTWKQIAQVVNATRSTDAYVELYLQYPNQPQPELGLTFQGGAYRGSGLGTDDPANQVIIDIDHNFIQDQPYSGSEAAQIIKRVMDTHGYQLEVT